MKLVLSISCALVFMGMACQTPLEKSLQVAGKNKKELKKALHYFKSDVNPKKYEAIRFLIEHMPGHYATDTGHLHQYRPFLPEATSIISTYAAGVEQTEALKKAWQNYKQEKVPVSASLKIQHDCRVVRSQFLIENCNQAFEAWETNAFYKNGSFENFLEYVLPYRRANGLPIENWRLHFTSKYADILSKYTGNNLLTVCDSLLYALRHLKHHQYAMSDYPLLKVADFETLKRGLCQHKCWYNSMFFASLGIPCAIDFVPAWGNRNAAHSWNVILRGNESFAFEPYWDADRWKYKRIYNNASWDDEWGKFRLPKVFRYTYSSHPEGPVIDSRVKPSDIPALFRNIKKKDVSAEYFKTEDISVRLTQPVPPDSYYCYLCVYGYQKWHPVQWGKINDGIATFKGMGRDIVYLPCYYKNGVFSHAANPFLLKSNGDIQELKGQSPQSVILNRVTPRYPRFKEGIEAVAGGQLEIVDSTLQHSQNVLTVPDTMLVASNMYHLVQPVTGRSVRFIFPSEQPALGEMAFYTKTAAGELKKLDGDLIGHDAIDIERAKEAVDGCAATAFVHKAGPLKKVEGHRALWIGMDFGRPVKIDAVALCPSISSNLWAKQQFELFYWQNGWLSVGVKTGNNHTLRFENVPANTLLMLKNTSWGRHSAERIFIYEDGEQKWH